MDASYGTGVTAAELAAKIVDPASATTFDPNVFSFFSEVTEERQRAFMDHMAVDVDSAARVAQAFSELAGFDLPLAC